MPWSDSYYDPPCDECEKCLEAGFEECQCLSGDGYDPLDDPNLLEDDYDGMTIEQIREVDDLVRGSCSLCGDLGVPFDSSYCRDCEKEVHNESQ